MTYAHKGSKGISLARGVIFRLQEGIYQFRGIGHQLLEICVYGGNCEDGILSHISMSVFETLTSRLYERLHEFCITDLGKESQGIATDILVWMLEVETDTVANK
jgi:hypothetical protein